MTPHSTETETSLIAALLFSPALIACVVEGLTPDHFFDTQLRSHWQQVRADFLAGREVDMVSVTNRLTEAGMFDDSMRVKNAELWSLHLGMAITHSAVADMVKTLDNHRILRGVVPAAQELTDAIAQHSLENVRAAAQRVAASVAEQAPRPGSTLYEIGLEVAEASGDVRNIGLATGFGWFDSKLGGLQPGRLIVVAAPRGGGKSAFVTQLVWNQVQAGIPCVFISREMSRREVFQRICCIEGVRSETWLTNKFNPRELETFKRVAGMRAAPLRIYDDLQSIGAIAARIRLDVMRFNTRVFVVDYIQRVNGEKGEGREREISGIAWELKELALNLGITVIAPSQLNADLQARESRDIENHADQMLIIARAQKGDEDDNGRRLIKIVKNRNGPSDCRCLYHFEGQHYRFNEIEETDADITSARETRNYGDR